MTSLSRLPAVPVLLLIVLLGACTETVDETPLAGAAGQATAVPDIAGYWMITFDPIPPLREPTSEEQAFLNGLAANAILLGDTGLPEFAPGEYGGLAMHQSAMDAARDYDPEEIRSVANTCKPPGLIYSMQGPFGMEIYQGTELIVIKMEYYDQVRVIFMNETAPPPEWPLSNMGYSTGYWEDGTLVVDTARLRPSTLFNNGVDHTDGIRVHERFRLSEDGSTLMVTQEFEDPGVFDGRAARLLPLIGADDHVYPYDCDPSYGIAIEKRSGPE